MNKNKKREIKDILNNEWDINIIIERIRDIDNDEEINTIWNDITTSDDFLYMLQEQDDLLNIYDMLAGINRSDLIDNNYFYYDGTDWYPASDSADDIINAIKEELA